MKHVLSPLLSTVAAILVALPAFASEPKKVILVTVTTGFRHSSIPTADKILHKLANESKAFTIVENVRQPSVIVPKKPKDATAANWTSADEEKAKTAQREWDAEMAKEMAKLSPENLANVDGVIFANTTGDLPLPDREGFIKWIHNGHALIAMHSASDTFHGFQPYIHALGGEFAGHDAQVGVTLHKQDAAHPATAGLPERWELKQEEMYLFKNYDQKRVRDLWIMDKHPNKGTPGHFPVSWVRKEGAGRVFYTSLGHREDLWDDDANLKNRINPPETAKQFQQHILGGIKWALGIEEGSADPQVR